MLNRAALYIHIPWCIRKCPYCDFNSHKAPTELPEKAYIQCLINDFSADLERFPCQEISSIFIGGGTPSLFSADAYESLFKQLQGLVPFALGLEITLEANPGTVEYGRFHDYRQLGINRLSLGIQSFHAEHLRSLGRIHDEKNAHDAIIEAKRAGFDNFNLDLMHGLPNQTLAEGLADLKAAVAHSPSHLSWYQLTIEPNTFFYKHPPALPLEEEAYELEQQGLQYLAQNGYERYEISAFCQEKKYSQHNLNYWLFYDYFGIGAGAHGKLTLNNTLYRTKKHTQPLAYLNPQKSYLSDLNTLQPQTLLFEFMLNTTRLQQPIPLSLFSLRTGLPVSMLMPYLNQAKTQQFITLEETYWQITPFGRRFTNELMLLFL